ncbi:hypothetical protein MIC448_650003 [Microbacterium sp. C448]|nr:hypothetical protein MIC448_650003 [Microbacterium sp. C448]
MHGHIVALPIMVITSPHVTKFGCHTGFRPTGRNASHLGCADVRYVPRPAVEQPSETGRIHGHG